MYKINLKIVLSSLVLLTAYMIFLQTFCMDNKEKFSEMKSILLNEDDVNKRINENDTNFYNKMSNIKLSTLLDNNKLSIPINKKNKILFVTFENRPIEKNKYIKIHNDNINEYCKLWNFEYKFITECKHNVYWSKIYLVLEELLTDLYDYVVWLDSDTFIFNKNMNISNIVNNYSSDIFVGYDNMKTYDMINAGVFIIKNSTIGINFLKDCIKNYNIPLCLTKNNKLRGKWAASCYEQGNMNILIYDTYHKNTTLLNNDIILNYNECYTNTFIMHLYAASDETRQLCFTSKYP